jgi:iron complex transport system substrate-binding protein
MKSFSLLRAVVFAVILLSATFANASENISISDMAGRKVAIPAKVEKLAAVTGTLRLVVYLGCQDMMAGIENLEVRYPADTGRPYSLALTGRIDKLPVIGEGGAGKLLDMERLLAARPDVVFTTDPTIAEAIQKNTGIPAVVVSYGQSSMLEKKDIISSLHLMGRILKKEKRAKEIEEFINAFEKDIANRTKDIPDKNRPKVYVGGIAYYGSHGLTSTEVFYPPFHWLRVRNVADEIGRAGSAFIEKEKLLYWNPDVMFIDTGGLNLVRNDYLKNREFYRKLRAVKEGKVYTVLPYTYYFTNVETAIANTYAIGKELYPSRFKDIDPLKKADEIFRFFTGMNVLEKLKQGDGYGHVLFSEERLKINRTP